MSPGSAVSEAFHDAEVADRAEYRFKNELRLAGIDGEWHTVPDGDSAELIELAKSVDLTIMGQHPPSAGTDRAARFRPEDVVIATGRPVLVVPYPGIFGSGMLVDALDDTSPCDPAEACRTFGAWSCCQISWASLVVTLPVMRQKEKGR